jgi:signal transduction histidine kinase
LTAYADDDTLGRAKVTEPYGYLLKPFKERELHTIIEVALFKHSSEKKLRQMQAQLAQNERMATLGRLIAAIAHEINNPLQAIQGCLNLARETLESDVRERSEQTRSSGRGLDAFLDVAEKETERIADVLRRVRDFYGPTHTNCRYLDLHAALEEALETCQQRLDANNVLVESSWWRELPRVHADPIQLQQVFQNIVLNAVEAMPEGGTLRLSTNADTIEPTGTEQSLDQTTAAPSIPAVCVSFDDTGIGISSQTQSRLFEPFFTTKDHRLGMGLPFCYGVIQAHGGQIRVESQEGVGTTFSILLPAAEKRPPDSDTIPDDE